MSMRNGRRTARRLWLALFLAGAFFPIVGCGPGTVYVGVAAPGPWVGYPGRGPYPGYPGYGRPWYSPDPEVPDPVLVQGEIGPPQAPAPTPRSPR